MEEIETQSQKPVGVEEVLDALESGSSERIEEIAAKAHPGDIEQALERLGDAAREEVLNNIPAPVLSEWADYLSASDLEHRLNSLTETDQRDVLDSLSDDELVDFIQEVEEEDRSQYVELLPEEKRLVFEDLMRYPEETAGGRMTKGMATIREGLTVKEALDELREIKEEAELLSRIFVVDEERRILGKVRMRDLAFATWDTPIRELMDSDQISIPALADQEEAAQMIARYDLVALPVVDEEGRLLGVITHDDALDILEEESTEDIEKLSGIGGERGEQAYLQTPVIAHYHRRVGWVVILAFLAISSGWVLLQFEEVLSTYFLLALYYPMIVAAGGNTGAQSATTVIRAMALGEVGSRELWRVVWKESRIGLLLGGSLGILVSLQVLFLLPDAILPEGVGLADMEPLRVALVVGVAISLQILTSTLFGSFLPLLAKRCHFDPAVVASPAITTMVDVSGSLIYFALATIVFL